jgi:hypothetical protein
MIIQNIMRKPVSNIQEALIVQPWKFANLFRISYAKDYGMAGGRAWEHGSTEAGIPIH